MLMVVPQVVSTVERYSRRDVNRSMALMLIPAGPARGDLASLAVHRGADRTVKVFEQLVLAAALRRDSGFSPFVDDEGGHVQVLLAAGADIAELVVCRGASTTMALCYWHSLHSYR